MSMCNLRIFTIVLVLELAVLESQVEAFTIQRPTEVTNSDLDVAESTHRLEVRNDLKSDIKLKEINNDSPPITAPIKTTAKTEEIQKNVTTPGDMENIKLSSASPNSPTATLMIGTSNNSNSSVDAFSTTTSHFNISSNTTQEITTTPTTSKTEVANVTINNNELLEKEFEKENSSLDFPLWTILKNTTNNITSIQKNNVTVNSTNIMNGTNKVNETRKNNMNVTKMNPISPLNTTTLVNISNETASEVNLVKLSMSNVNVTLVNTTSGENYTEIKEETRTDESNGTSYSTDTVYKSTNQNTHDGPMTTSTSKYSEIKLSLDQSNDSKIILDTETKSSPEIEKSTEELTGEQSEVTVKPYWKKYTTIDRTKQRLNTTEENVTSTELSSTEYVSTMEFIPSNESLSGPKSTSSTERDLVQSATAQTQRSISFEEALNTVSEIPSLEHLKNELLGMNKTNLINSTRSANSTEILKSNTTQPETTEKLLVNETTGTLETTTQAYNIVSSKRAGFLDFSTRPVVRTENSTNEEPVKLTEAPWNYYNVSPYKTTTRNPTSKTSQSQLVEDAIKEELMKEEFLIDSVENAQRQQEDRLVSETIPTEKVQINPTVNLTTSESSAEEKLRVKPINIEKPKNGSIYTVNPNYKPLKKIEVQPPKPFMRNPDDNSWRNESLSSLGIVFKANNSSKPLTQVLKNKTESHWNTLLERYEKGDEPELRTRLEKIAEMRKSKKKKTNSVGETVYSDYEETVSSENPNSTNSESVTYANKASFLDEVQKDKLATIEPDYLEVKTTTVKAKKFLDEYEEDDEMDYTLPNIDIKKFITSPATKPTPGRASVLPIQFTSPIFSNTARINPSERQPTIQYFPPIAKNQKVNINDYDTAFQKKINDFTTNTPRTFTTSFKPESPPAPVTFDFQKNKFEPPSRPTSNEISRRPDQMDKNVYLTNPPQDGSANGFVRQNQDSGGYNQASYVIKHLRDFIDEVVKSDVSSATDEPIRGVTINTPVHETKQKPPNDYYDYEAQFRKDVINRFAENFNMNSERFKSDFPVLYNTSVVHSLPGPTGGAGAESTAFMKRLYEDVRVFQHPKDAPKRYDPNCDHTIELSPAYELHYYVPEEEEKEEVELKTLTKPPQHHRLQL